MIKRVDQTDVPECFLHQLGKVFLTQISILANEFITIANAVHHAPSLVGKRKAIMFAQLERSASLCL
jgi:hypothetical protein